MNKKKPDNRGISLVELMVALAILALLMTAVIMMMSNNTIVYKKNKAEVTVQTNAQETYSILQDSIMQAKAIKIEGYTGDTVKASQEYKCEVLGDGTIKNGFIDEATGKMLEIHPTKIEIQYCALKKKKEDGSLVNYDGTVTYYFVRYTDGSDKKCSIFVEHKYDSTSGIENDTWEGNTDVLDAADNWKPELETGSNAGGSTKKSRDAYDDWLLSSSLTDTTLMVDAENQAISIAMHFMERNRIYDTSGIVTIRNSYVLNKRRERNGGGSSDTNTSETNNSEDFHNE